jgi:hypothetical protein
VVEGKERESSCERGREVGVGGGHLLLVQPLQSTVPAAEITHPRGKGGRSRA